MAELTSVSQLATQHAQDSFLASFAESGSVGAACIASGVPVGTVDSWESRDTQDFKRRKAEMVQIALGRIEAEITRRAIEGVDHPVIHQGVITATYKQYSDNLLMFRAKRLDPEYRDNPRLQQQTGSPAVTKIIINLAPGVEMPREMIVEATEFREVEEEHGTNTV